MQVTQEVYNEVAILGLVLKTPLAHGILEAPAQNDHIYRMEVTVWFPQVKHESPAVACCESQVGMPSRMGP